MRKWLTYAFLLFGCGLAVIYSIGFFADLNGTQVIAGIRNIQPSRLLVLYLVNLIILVVTARRWQLLLPSNLPLIRLALNRLTGFALSYITPGTQIGGEAAQVGLLTKINGLSSRDALRGVASERGVDFLGNVVIICLLSFFFGGAFFRQMDIRWESLYLIYGGLVALSAAVLIYLPGSYYQSALRFIKNDLSLLMHIVVLTLLIWILFMLELWLIFAALGVTLDLQNLLILLLAIRLAFWLPLPVPAAAGVLEASLLFAADLCAIDSNFALSAALLMRFRDVVLVCIGLAYGVISGGLPAFADKLKAIKAKFPAGEGLHD